MPGVLRDAEALLRKLVAGTQSPDPLTAREREVAELVAQALSNKEVASKLVVSEHTVESHVRNILTKTGLRSRTALSAGFSNRIPADLPSRVSVRNGVALIRSRHEPRSAEARPIMINRVQALVLAFFLMAWISLVAILIAAPEVYERRLRSLPGAQRIVDVVFVVALTAFIVFLSIGVLRRWRWAFWLILIAFLFGVLRVPVAVLQLSGQMTPDGPTWYVILQGVIGVVQVVIALAMILAYRRSGIWGS